MFNNGSNPLGSLVNWWNSLGTQGQLQGPQQDRQVAQSAAKRQQTLKLLQTGNYLANGGDIGNVADMWASFGKPGEEDPQKRKAAMLMSMGEALANQPDRPLMNAPMAPQVPFNNQVPKSPLGAPIQYQQTVQAQQQRPHQRRQVLTQRYGLKPGHFFGN